MGIMQKEDLYKIVPEMYRNYGLYSNKEKMFPSTIDGLLPIHRRMLTTLHFVAKNEYVKTAKVIGECMGRYHPHAITESPVQYLVSNNFADGQGSWGTNLGIQKIECAAMRYTKVKTNSFIEKTAFKYINYVPWEEGDLEKEPKYIPTQYPLCFISKNETIMIGFGFKTEIPCYNINDIFKRLQFLKGRLKTKPSLFPVVPGCKILSQNKECEQILKTGTGSIEIQGIYDIDKKEKKVYIYGWSPRIGFESILSKIDNYEDYNLLTDQHICFTDISTKETGTKIMFEVNKKRNTDEYFDKMVESIDSSLKANLGYNIWTVDPENNLVLKSVDDMLLGTFEYYQEALKNYLEYSIKKIEEKIEELNIIEKIKPYLSEALQIVNKKYDQAAIADFLYKKINDKNIKKEDISGIINNYKIKSLFSVSTDISVLKTEMDNMKVKLVNIEETAMDEYKESV
jgi:DNA gyrase subunit A